MSSETSSVIISVCAIAAVVGVLIILGGFLVVRIFKTSIFGMAMMAFRLFTEPKDEPSTMNVRAESASRSRSRDLRAQAQSVDFDSAVARYSGSSTPPTTTGTNPIAAQSAPVDSRPPSLRDRPRRRPTEEHDEDADFLESFLDED